MRRLAAGDVCGLSKLFRKSNHFAIESPVLARKRCTFATVRMTRGDIVIWERSATAASLTLTSGGGIY
eukprot:5651837-Pyramimonas_sp.AAC.2